MKNGLKIRETIKTKDSQYNDQQKRDKKTKNYGKKNTKG